MMAYDYNFIQVISKQNYSWPEILGHNPKIPWPLAWQKPWQEKMWKRDKYQNGARQNAIAGKIDAKTLENTRTIQ
jgi:hypothetical protein